MHEGDHFHEHDHDHHLDDHTLYQDERVTLYTVGIDIGSSTMHLMFSKLVLLREGKHLSSRYVVTEREKTYVSPVYLTPYLNSATIDAAKIREFLDVEYKKAGKSPDEVDTGAVIVTGEAAMKENAENIIAIFSEQAGKFVCATAGPNLEATLAAYGSGAVSASQNKTVLNIDIGGGTTKFALIHNGRITDTAAVSIGARLIAWDDNGNVIRVEKTAEKFLPQSPSLGEAFSQESREQFADKLCDALFVFIDDFMSKKQSSAEWESFYITPGLIVNEQIEEILFSGGVAEFIYGYEDHERGDLGLLLGGKIRQRLQAKKYPLRLPDERIRATVIGASQYSVQLSGNTILLSDEQHLPLRNVPVFSIDLKQDDGTFSSLSKQLNQAFQRFDFIEGSSPFALSINWPGGIDYHLLRQFCEQLCLGLPLTSSQSQHPLLLTFDSDVAGLVGRLLLEEFELKCPVLSIDQVDIRDLDFVDIGKPLPISGVVPIVIKSLVFK